MVYLVIVYHGFIVSRYFLIVNAFSRKLLIFIMYTAAFLSERIKTQAKIKKIKLKDMLEDLSLNINTISQISDKKGLSCFPLARIADYLDCSVDYLLGRTDNPNSHKM